MKSVLAYRFSAFGDVLLCYPVLRSVLDLNPDLEITFVTQKFLSPFFTDIPRLKVVGVDLKKDYPGLKGIYKLSKDLSKNNTYDAICDLHQVARTYILNFFMGLKTYKINKGRKAKRNFLKNLEAKNLPHSTERYLQVFKQAGLNVTSNLEDLKKYTFKSELLSLELSKVVHGKDCDQTNSPNTRQVKNKIKLGFAPNAKHFTKTWPKEHFESFIANNEVNQKMHIFLFGGPGEEAKYFSQLEQKYSCVTNLAGQFKFKDEITLMQAMDQMVVMDSANMHLASLAGVPLISIWGGTHPGVGFYPLAKQAQILQIDRSLLSCRPCSVFGRGDCPQKHFKCMLDIGPEVLMNEVLNFKDWDQNIRLKTSDTNQADKEL
jgi:ADP-heptose:LPS heptosyltransferase